MSMTRKDYEGIAKALATAMTTAEALYGERGRQSVRLAIMALADTVLTHNINFDREKFLDAVYGEEK